MKRLCLAWMLCLPLLGCGTELLTNSQFANRLVGVDGQLFSAEELEDIARDPDLTDEQKRQAFRDLGIEDEVLIDSLLEL